MLTRLEPAMTLNHRVHPLLALGFCIAAACDSARPTPSAVIPTPTAEAGTYITSKGTDPACLLRIGPGFVTRAWALRCSSAPVAFDTLTEVAWVEAGGSLTAMRQESGDSVLIATSPDCIVSVLVNDRLAQMLSVRLFGPCNKGGPLVTRLAATLTFFLPAADSASAQDSEADRDRRLRHARPLAQRWMDFALIARGAPTLMTDELRSRCIDLFAQGLTERRGPGTVSAQLAWDDGCAGLAPLSAMMSDTLPAPGGPQ